MITAITTPLPGSGHSAPSSTTFASSGFVSDRSAGVVQPASASLRTEAAWRPVPGWPAYEMSADGILRRCLRWRHRQPHTTLVPFIRQNGYAQIILHQDGRRQRFGVHQLVALAFLGPKPSLQHEVAHLDGQRLNNHVSNLAWLLHSENERHKELHGTRLRGSQVGNAKLNEAQVALIRQALTEGQRQSAMARHYGVSSSTVHLVAKHKTWRHVR